MMNISLSISIAFFLSTFLAAIVSRWGYRFVLLDNPNARSSHSHPTPRGGGIGIWITFILIGIFGIKDVLFTVIGGAAGLLGLFGDRFNLHSTLRLTIQLLLSAMAVYIFIALSSPSSLTPRYLLFTFLFWTIFITGTANFYNFMDGINGIAGLTGVVGFGLLAFFSFFIAHESNVGLLSISLVSACIGFLPFNFPKAKVFMGDVGSIFLGFVFASFVVKLSSDISTFLSLSMFLCTFYGDALLTIYHRWKRRENLTKAHRNHLYQYLSNELKLPHWKVSLAYAIIQLAFGVLGLIAFKYGLLWQLALVGIFAALFISSYIIIKKIKI